MASEGIKKAIEEEQKAGPAYEENKKLKETIRVLREEFGSETAAVILPQMVRVEF